MRYRWWVAIATALFLCGLGLGLLVPAGGAGLLADDLGSLQRFAEFLQGLSPGWMFVLILAKNISAVLFSFIFAPVLLIAPVFALVVNGLLIGLVAGPLVVEKSVGYVLAGILPHGVFELPALMIAEAAALSFGVSVILMPFRQESRRQLPLTFRRNLRYLTIAIVLLVPAAVIEAFVTPRLLR